MTSIQRASVRNGQPYRYQDDTEDEDDVWPPPVPRSAIRYTTTDRTPVITSGNRRYILHEGVPPPLPRQKAEAVPRPRRRVHWSLIFGIGMVVMLSLWVLGNMLVNWWNITQDDLHYGRPRTFQTDAVVGHNDSVSAPSHFIAINFNRHIQIIEFPGGDTTHARIYQGATLQTVTTTGKGHQDPRAATGYITFFNGQLTSVTVKAETVITGASGRAIVTDQDVTIPPADPTANPPIFGRVTISAHATHPGTAGNMAAYAINQPCCRASVIAKNMTPFSGGQDKRKFYTVSTADIGITATALNTTLTESMHGALQGQLRQREALQTLPCTPTVTADHHIGEEAVEVKVTVSETCSAVAYNTDALVRKATDLLSHQALYKLGTGYSLFGQVQITITQATVTPTTATLIFSCQGKWVYALSQQAQQQMKHCIAGKPRKEAIKLLLSLPGIETATIEGDDQTQLPKSLDALHLSIIVPQS